MENDGYLPPGSWEESLEVLAPSCTSCSNLLGFPFPSRAGNRTQESWLGTKFKQLLNLDVITDFHLPISLVTP